MPRGNCYVTCEALYHLLGGKEGGWAVYRLRHEGDTHWFLRHLPSGLLVDPTVSQFKTKPSYWDARCTGFLTKEPSARARALMQKLVWQEEP